MLLFLLSSPWGYETSTILYKIAFGLTISNFTTFSPYIYVRLTVILECYDLRLTYAEEMSI